MLGYDTHDKRYVWLVTSILKDERLRTETCPATLTAHARANVTRNFDS
jgi:hypothetical protein